MKTRHRRPARKTHRRPPACRPGLDALEARTHLSLAPLALAIGGGARDGHHGPGPGQVDGPGFGGPRGGADLAPFFAHRPGDAPFAPPPRGDGRGWPVPASIPVSGRVEASTSSGATPATQPAPVVAASRPTGDARVTVSPSETATPAAPPAGILAPGEVLATGPAAPGGAATAPATPPSGEDTAAAPGGSPVPAVLPAPLAPSAAAPARPGAPRTMGQPPAPGTPAPRAVRISLRVPAPAGTPAAPTEAESPTGRPLSLGVDLMLEPGLPEGLGRLDAALSRFLDGLDDLAEPIEAATADPVLVVGAVAAATAGAALAARHRLRRRGNALPAPRPAFPGNGGAFPYA